MYEKLFITIFSIFKLPVAHYQNLYLDLGEKINSPLNDDFRFSVFAYENQIVKKQDMAM